MFLVKQKNTIFNRTLITYSSNNLPTVTYHTQTHSHTTPIILQVHTHHTMFEIITPTYIHTCVVMTSSDNLSPAPCN